jgi:DegV family protein with EDD domain
VPIRLVCDSSCNVPPTYQEKLGIIQVPAWVNFADGTSLRNGVDISDAEFYRRLQTERQLPTTSQPTPEDFVQAIEAAEGDEFVIAAVSSKMSGTFNSALQAAALLSGRKKVHTYDTLSASMGSGWQIIAGAEAAAAGADAAGVLAALRAARERIFTCFTIDTLKYLAASGRAPMLQAMMGNLLDIKPLLEIQDGTLHLVQRVRGRQKSKRELVAMAANHVGERPVRVAIVNANVPDEAAGLADEVRARLHCREIQIVELGPVLGALAGPGTLAIAAFVLPN